MGAIDRRIENISVDKTSGNSHFTFTLHIGERWIRSLGYNGLGCVGNLGNGETKETTTSSITPTPNWEMRGTTLVSANWLPIVKGFEVKSQVLLILWVEIRGQRWSNSYLWRQIHLSFTPGVAVGNYKFSPVTFVDLDPEIGSEIDKG